MKVGNMKIKWTKRGQKRFAECSDYITSEFYPDYADAWEEDVAQTVEHLPLKPNLGIIAFPKLSRPELRKILLHNRRYWVYYRVTKTAIEILSIRHTLMNINSPRQL